MRLETLLARPAELRAQRHSRSGVRTVIIAELKTHPAGTSWNENSFLGSHQASQNSMNI
jgi:hypothetical protein